VRHFAGGREQALPKEVRLEVKKGEAEIHIVGEPPFEAVLGVPNDEPSFERRSFGDDAAEQTALLVDLAMKTAWRAARVGDCLLWSMGALAPVSHPDACDGAYDRWFRAVVE
jgi:hypothetical protein